MSNSELASRIGGGLLSFPVTHFDDHGMFVESNYREHCSWLLEYDVAGLFAAGGTGEFFSLAPQEVSQVVKAAVSEVNGRVPVIAGCGYGTAMAVELAKSAEKAGADGLLLLPPYLVNASQEGLYAHVDAVCQATDIGVIVYNRDNGVVQAETLERLCDKHENLIGFKDGVGDIELMMRVVHRMGDRLTYIGGLPTAETFAQAYLAMGVTTYSSAIFNFLPEWALTFYRAVKSGDQETMNRAMEDFLFPYLQIRNKTPGYAVSIVKAGMRAIGRPAGPVRSPLTDLTAEEQNALKTLIDKATA